MICPRASWPRSGNSARCRNVGALSGWTWFVLGSYLVRESLLLSFPLQPVGLPERALQPAGRPVVALQVSEVNFSTREHVPGLVCSPGLRKHRQTARHGCGSQGAQGQELQPLSNRAQAARRSVVAPLPVASGSFMGRQAPCVFGSVAICPPFVEEPFPIQACEAFSTAAQQLAGPATPLANSQPFCGCARTLRLHGRGAAASALSASRARAGVRASLRVWCASVHSSGYDPRLHRR